MFRAVKVVRREDFEYQRTFEREFEGIQRYEKVSHEHPGLVDILHVGRDDEAGFYYYVMEIADDASGGTVEELLESYRPRTLSSDIRRRSLRTVRESVDLGVAIGGALGHLHHAGLTHRDVKPSNIIFVKGQPKLADVGLVASTGQRTFVGTEGYVPPEGPGTSSADLYSLAMVLYEMHTGKDRLDFPELPTNLEIPASVNPDPRKRYESAAAFVLALETVCAAPWKAPEPRRGIVSTLFGIAAVLGLFGILGLAGYWLWKDKQSFTAQHGALLSDAGTKGVNGAGLRTPIEVKPIREGGANAAGPPPFDPTDDVDQRIEVEASGLTSGRSGEGRRG
jgi:serine/threonine protein kinase